MNLFSFALITSNFIFCTQKNQTKIYNIIHIPKYDHPIEIKTNYVIMLSSIYKPLHRDLFEKTKIKLIISEKPESDISFEKMARCNISLFVDFFIELLKFHNYNDLKEIEELFERTRKPKAKNIVLHDKTKIYYTFKNIMDNVSNSIPFAIPNKCENPQETFKYINKLNYEFIIQNLEGYNLLYKVYPYLIYIYESYENHKLFNIQSIYEKYNKINSKDYIIFDITDVNIFNKKMKSLMFEMKSYKQMKINMLISLHEIFFLLIIKIIEENKTFDIGIFEKRLKNYFKNLDLVERKFKKLFYDYSPDSQNLEIKLDIKYIEKTLCGKILVFFNIFKRQEQPKELNSKTYQQLKSLADKTRKRLENFENKLQNIILNYTKVNYFGDKTEPKNLVADLQNLIILKHVKFLKSKKRDQ